jgi:hypothetical protein
MFVDCKLCGVEFDINSPSKKRAGGLSIHCPDCSNESCVRYLGVSSGDGKVPTIGILKFDKQDDRDAYRDAWWVNSGMMVGKSCQLGRNVPTPGVRFKTVLTTGPMNHKGKL